MAFVAGSALLTDALSANERASIQGLADLFMGLMGALGSATGGMILGIWGFAILNAAGALLVLGPPPVTLLRRPMAAKEGRTIAGFQPPSFCICPRHPPRYPFADSPP